MTELDLALLNALQLRPRSSWAELAPSLGVDASTLARRWQRLHEDGLAWITPTPGPELGTRPLAFVRVSCLPPARDRLVRELRQCPEVGTLDITTGGTDLLLDVLSPDLFALGTFLTETLDRLPGVTATSALFATMLHRSGTRWRLRSLDREQIATLAGASGADRADGGVSTFDALDRALLVALGHDGRLSWADLAERTNTSPATARRRVNRLIAGNTVSFRCDVADQVAGNPVSVNLFGQVPAEDIDRAYAAIAALPQTRLVATVTGPDNLMITLWLPDTGGISRLETSLARQVPSLRITGRIVTLRPIKRMGHLLDSRGRRTGAVPIAAW